MESALNYIVEQGLILIPVLLILGQIIKNLESIKDKYIPLILLPISILLSFGVMGISVDSVVQSILILGVSVYGNQIVKQLRKEE